MDLHINFWNYALEIEKVGSIRKAAENLFMGQPNLSRALAELEDNIGIRIFERSSQGVRPTPEGEEFLICARAVLQHISAVEKRFNPAYRQTKTMHVQVPRSRFSSLAMARLISEIGPEDKADIRCEESVSADSVQNVIRAKVNLAIIRFHSSEHLYYRQLFHENNILFDEIWRYNYVVTLSSQDPLAAKDVLTRADLQNYREVVHAHRTADLFLPDSDAGGTTGTLPAKPQIYVNDRSTQLDIIRQAGQTFMWGAPFGNPGEAEAGLVQCPFKEDEAMHYIEGSIRRRAYKPTALEERFLEIFENLVKHINA